tara:strand:+ start:8787 stop:8918 length:132 start_codon:yes stop_codon:yes gene_type:complete
MKEKLGVGAITVSGAIIGGLATGGAGGVLVGAALAYLVENTNY